MAMAEHSAVTEEVLDAIGELGNMIIGNVKTELEGTEGPLAVGPPTVIFGRNYHARSSAVREWLVVPFQCGEDRLEIDIFLAPAADLPPAPPPQMFAAGAISRARERSVVATGASTGGPSAPA